MKYFNTTHSIKRDFTRSLRYISIVLIFSTMGVHGVGGGDTYEDVFKEDIYDVSETMQSKFTQASKEDANERDKQLAGLAHEAAKAYKVGSNDYLAVATLYYQKLQGVHDRLTSYIKDQRDFLEGMKNQLIQFHKEKTSEDKVRNVFENITTWATSALKNPIFATGQAALHLLTSLSSSSANARLDLLKDTHEIDKAVRELNKKIIQLENGVLNEPIKELEESYVKQKALGENFIPRDLQETIEGNLINSRKATYPFPWVKKCLENALKLPKTHKMLTFKRLEAFKRDEFFQRYSLETREGLEDIANDLIRSSDAPNTSKVPLRSICYVHGKPGIGKTEAVRYLAEFFDLPVVKLNIKSVEDLSAPNLVGMEALMPGATAGWLGRPLLATNSEGKTYLNAVLILDEFDRILLSPNAGITGLAFFLDFLDPSKKSFYSPYFNAEVDISRMHIFVTGNSEIPNTDEYQPLKERFSEIIGFEPMKTEYQKEILLGYLIDLGKFYKISNDDLDIQKNYLTEAAMQLADNPSSIRSCKQALRNIVRNFSRGGRAKVHAFVQEKEKVKE